MYIREFSEHEHNVLYNTYQHISKSLCPVHSVSGAISYEMLTSAQPDFCLSQDGNIFS